MKKYPGLILFVLFVILILIWPEIDLVISGWFFNETAGVFYLKGHPLTDFIYDATHWVGYGVFISLVTLLIAHRWLTWQWVPQQKKIWFMLIFLFLGPGLIVNTVLKENWERPRPGQTDVFGGHKPFESPFNPKFDCTECYSFVSGHASMGFYFFALSILQNSRLWLIVPFSLGGIIGVTRIVQGGHYFSDVVFSGFLLWFLAYGLHRLMFKTEYEVKQH